MSETETKVEPILELSTEDKKAIDILTGALFKSIELILIKEDLQIQPRSGGIIFKGLNTNQSGFLKIVVPSEFFDEYHYTGGATFFSKVHCDDIANLLAKCKKSKKLEIVMYEHQIELRATGHKYIKRYVIPHRADPDSDQCLPEGINPELLDLGTKVIINPGDLSEMLSSLVTEEKGIVTMSLFIQKDGLLIATKDSDGNESEYTLQCEIEGDTGYWVKYSNQFWLQVAKFEKQAEKVDLRLGEYKPALISLELNKEKVSKEGEEVSKEKFNPFYASFMFSPVEPAQEE